MSEVLIIGAGVAGLAAAEVLAEQGLNLTLLEARDRIGGRILTVPSVSGDFPVELGAEFIHGAKNGLWPIVQQSEIRVDEVPAGIGCFLTAHCANDQNFMTPLKRFSPKSRKNSRI
jgi:monoamine oxidase